MNIKDPQVRELAMQFADRRGTSATGAIRQALIESLDRDRHEREGLAQKADGARPGTVLEAALVLGRTRVEALDEPLLFKGEDFTHTDVPSAL